MQQVLSENSKLQITCLITADPKYPAGMNIH